MSVTVKAAKERLDSIIKKSRVDLYKPIQIAEVLYHSRVNGRIDVRDKNTFQNPSCSWRDAVTIILTGKKCTSSARFQHDLWNSTAMAPEFLYVLDKENQETCGLVERYIYFQYEQRQGTVSSIVNMVNSASPESFQLHELIQTFVSTPGIKRSIDKAYEIVTYALLETVVCSLEATISISVPDSSLDILREFEDLAKVVLGVDVNSPVWSQSAHIYRVGVTNAADRGLDMWANFGPAIQVKHLTLSKSLVNDIVDQVESDHIVIVCCDADADVIDTITRQIGWGKRIRGIIKENDLINWYEKCLRGKFSEKIAVPLLETLVESFLHEFPQTSTLTEFLKERGYLSMSSSGIW